MCDITYFMKLLIFLRPVPQCTVGGFLGIGLYDHSEDRFTKHRGMGSYEEW